jgi:hypothetical protein
MVRQATFPLAAASHLQDSRRAVPAPTGGKVMELAAMLMFAAVGFGFVQQFDRQHW